MQRSLFVIVGIALAAAGIGAIISLFGGSASPAANSQPAAVDVPFTDLAHGSQSTVAARVNYLITSVDQLNKLWKMISATGTPPIIDFKTNAVIAVFADKNSSAAIAVSKIEDTNVRLVAITVMKPSSACAQKQLAASPYDIVAVPGTSLPLTHQDIPTVVSCRK
ncbi:MAG: hypothetical protein ACYC6X_03875 [Minisyncoccota bacterium]